MKSLTFLLAILVAFCTIGQAQDIVDLGTFDEFRPLRNEDVVTMLKGGLSEEIVKAKIRASVCEFDTSAEALTELKAAGASDQLILTILETQHPSLKSESPEQVRGAVPPAVPATQAQPSSAPVSQGPAQTTTQAQSQQPQPPPQQVPTHTTQPSSQPPPYEPVQYEPEPTSVTLFGGYSFGRTYGDLDEANLHGWNVGLSVAVTDWLAIAGDISGHYIAFDGFGLDADASIYSFAAGPQFSTWGRTRRVRGFGHVLVGAGRLGIGVGFLGDSDTNLDMLVGGGLDVGLTEHLAVRAFQGDWLHIFGDGYSVNMLRLSFGLVGRF